MKTQTMTFPSTAAFNMWFKVRLLPILKANGVKGVLMNVSERHIPRGIFRDKEIYYHCVIPELQTEYHFYVKRGK